jgi:hypothetical protein
MLLEAKWRALITGPAIIMGQCTHEKLKKTANEEIK